MRKLTAIIIMLTLMLALALALVGCSKDETPPAAPDEPAMAEPVDMMEEPGESWEPGHEDGVDGDREPGEDGAMKPMATPGEAMTDPMGPMIVPMDPMIDPVTGAMTDPMMLPDESTTRGTSSLEDNRGIDPMGGAGSQPGFDMMPKDGLPGIMPDGDMGHDARRRLQPESRLKAGEVDDNARWDEYLEFVEEYDNLLVHVTSLEGRQIVTVLDREGRPVPNAVVTLNIDGEDIARQLTYADGRTIVFTNDGMMNGSRIPNPLTGGSMTGDPTVMDTSETAYTIRAERDGFKGSIQGRDIGKSRSHEIELTGRMDYGNRLPLDVLFLLDTTGSMSDEIHQIKSTLDAITLQVEMLPSRPDLRLGMVAYRDRGDDYVTRLYQFDDSVARFTSAIHRVSANGGGDYPESLNEAFAQATQEPEWRQDAVRLIFLIADAPPHLDYPYDDDYAVEMVRARERGIKVFSVASSGLDEQGEYIFRQIAQQTMGRFLFILYSSGGPQGELTTPHDVEQFTVNRLDQLIVRLIQEELAALGGEQPDLPSGPRMIMK